MQLLKWKRRHTLHIFQYHIKFSCRKIIQVKNIALKKFSSDHQEEINGKHYREAQRHGRKGYKIQEPKNERRERRGNIWPDNDLFSLVSRSLTPKFKTHNVSQMNKQIRTHLDPTLSHQKTPHISMKTKGEKYHQLRFWGSSVFTKCGKITPKAWQSKAVLYNSKYQLRTYTKKIWHKDRLGPEDLA